MIQTADFFIEDDAECGIELRPCRHETTDTLLRFLDCESNEYFSRTLSEGDLKQLGQIIKRRLVTLKEAR